MVMEKSWNMKNWPKVMEFCDQSWNFTNFAPIVPNIYIYATNLEIKLLCRKSVECLGKTEKFSWKSILSSLWEP